MIRILALTAVATAVPVPTTKYVVKLRNGVEMPMMAAGTWQYPGKTMTEHCFTITGGSIPQGILSENMGNHGKPGKALKAVSSSEFGLVSL